jgi:MFS family permease
MVEHQGFWVPFLPKKELTQIYISMALRYFAVSLIGIFVPLYLMQEIGVSLQQALLFYVFYSVVFAVSAPVAAKFASTYGLKHSVMLAIPFYLAFVWLLYLLPTVNISLLVISGLLGLSQAFYWMGLHLIFKHASDKKHRGEECGKRTAFSKVGMILGPTIGGILITYYGFGLAFICASILLLLAGGVLFLSKEEHMKFHFSAKTIFNKNYWRDSLYFTARGVRNMAEGVLWPIFIFFILGSYVSLGILGSILAGVTAVLVWLSGKYSDRVGKRKVIRWIVPFEALGWLARAFVQTVSHVFGATIFGALSFGALDSPISARMYDKAKGDLMSYFVSREIFMCLGRILVLMLVIMTDNISGGFIFTSVASFAALLF